MPNKNIDNQIYGHFNDDLNTNFIIDANYNYVIQFNRRQPLKLKIIDSYENIIRIYNDYNQKITNLLSASYYHKNNFIIRHNFTDITFVGCLPTNILMERYDSFNYILYLTIYYDCISIGTLTNFFTTLDILPSYYPEYNNIKQSIHKINIKFNVMQNNTLETFIKNWNKKGIKL